MRHGRTSYNIEGRFLGQTNIPLCKQGIKEIEKIASEFPPLFFKKIYSSEYIRAVETAEIIASNSQLEVIKSRRLIERNLGILDGKKNKNPEIIKNLSDFNFIPLGGESVRSCITRFSDEINNIATNSEGNVLVVSHGGIINLYMKYIINSKSGRNFLDNGAFHVIESVGGSIRLR
ncbi:histidine phosphatase family protein [Vibrio ouci]|nr:histidine phosphatase family protein [Vibrio ouci]